MKSVLYSRHQVAESEHLYRISFHMKHTVKCFQVCGIGKFTKGFRIMGKSRNNFPPKNQKLRNRERLASMT